MKLGAQFYSIRDNTTTPEDLKSAFEKIKKIGYEISQMSAICEIDPTNSMPLVFVYSPKLYIQSDVRKPHLISGLRESSPMSSLNSMTMLMFRRLRGGY